MKTCKEMSVLWNVTERSVTSFCKDGKIPGAVKVGGRWQIPDDAVKPEDGRISSGKYIKHKTTQPESPRMMYTEPVPVPYTNGQLKALPIGISDYIRAQAEYYYVDKTLFIKEFIDRKPLVSLFTRPRRFGKTLNMDMLRVFFERTEEDTSQYFKDKDIWRCGQAYCAYQGRYPVIFLSFKDVKFNSWEATMDKIRGLVQVEYGRHRELLDSSRLAQFEKDFFSKIIEGNASEVELASSVEALSRMLAEHYGEKTVVIIDEYDTPIQEGYSQHFYEEIISFMRNFFSAALKDNRYLAFGFLTGILRIAQESIFSGLNNLAVNSVLDDEYDRFFGFTQPEVDEMMRYYGVTDKKDELKTWYDGYLFGRKEIYNPWSVINYIARGCIPQAYWVNTGKNEILEDILAVATDDIMEKLYSLVQAEFVAVKIDQNVVYRSHADNPSNIYSVLLVAGYLKALKKEIQPDGTWLCEVAIPNYEIKAVYKSEILSRLVTVGAVSQTTADKIAESLFARNHAKLQDAIGEYLKTSVSFYDTGTEGFYHGLVLGLVALMDNQYIIRSNRESGNGRYDISMFPREKRYPGIIMEMKAGAGKDDSGLTVLAKKALEQIRDKNYDTEMKINGVEDILKLGIAFSGKNVKIATW